MLGQNAWRLLGRGDVPTIRVGTDTWGRRGISIVGALEEYGLTELTQLDVKDITKVS